MEIKDELQALRDDIASTPVEGLRLTITARNGRISGAHVGLNSASHGVLCIDRKGTGKSTRVLMLHMRAATMLKKMLPKNEYADLSTGTIALDWYQYLAENCGECFRNAKGDYSVDLEKNDNWDCCEIQNADLIAIDQLFYVIEQTSQNASRAIPVEFRTKPISKVKAARFLGRTGDENRAVEWLSNCIADGTIAWQCTSRQSGFYDLRQFPEDKRNLLKP